LSKSSDCESARTSVLLLGLGPTALTALESLAKVFTVLGIVRDPDDADPVVACATHLGVPVYTETSLAALEELILQLRPGCTVVSSYNRILGPRLLDLCPFVNVHYAPLPRYRGRANVNWALINRELCTAITIHRIAPGLDAGNILFQQLVPIGDTDTVADLYARLNAIQQEVLGETVARFLAGYEGEPQREDEATYGCTRLPEDGEIDWAAPTRQIDALVRALVPPFPGAYTYLQGKRLILWRACPVANPPAYVGRVPGRVIGVSKSDGVVDVLTGDGVLRLAEVQLEGKERVPAAQVIRSVKETLGLRVSHLLNRIASLEAELAQMKGESR
jgi:methionyl-tRNA formyltransferase